MKHKTNIEADKYYSINAIIRQGLFPMIQSHQTLSKYIKSDAGRKLFKPISRHTGRYIITFVKGSVLSDIRERADKGLLNI